MEMGSTGGLYHPNLNYLGADQATFFVQIGSLKVKVVYHFKVIDGGAIGGTEQQDKQNCPKGRAWKISTISDASGNLIVTSVDYQSPITDARTFTTDAVALSSNVLDSFAVDPSAIALNFADLTGAAAALTSSLRVTS